MANSCVTLKDSLDLIDKKLVLINRYYEITKKQNHLLEKNNYNQENSEEEDDFSEIQDIIDEKDKIIIKVNGLDTDFVESFESFKKTLGKDGLDSIASDDNFISLQNKIKAIFESLDLIKNIELKNNEKMQKIYDDVKKSIKNFNDNNKNQMPKKIVTDLDKGFYVDQKQ